MSELDDTINQVERLYRRMTGKEPPAHDATYAPIPPEKNPQQHVEEQIERLCALLGQPTGAKTPLPSYTPPITVAESPQEMLICVDLPGVARDAVAVSVMQGLLTVSAERTTPFPDGEALALRLSERPVGAFRRMVPLPPWTVPEQMSAELQDGVLYVRVPCTAAPASRSIPVK